MQLKFLPTVTFIKVILQQIAIDCRDTTTTGYFDTSVIYLFS